MPTNLKAKSSVTINAPAARVWEAITTPAQIKQWFFGVDTVSDWKPGSPLIHTGVWQGKPYSDKGAIQEIKPPRLLVHTHWSQFSGLPDAPENYQTVTYTVADHAGHTDLTISEVNLPSEEAKAQSDKSWTTVLGNLKTMLEK